MAKYDKADLERRMHGAIEALKSDLSGVASAHAVVFRPFPHGMSNKLAAP